MKSQHVLGLLAAVSIGFLVVAILTTGVSFWIDDPAIKLLNQIKGLLCFVGFGVFIQLPARQMLKEIEEGDEDVVS